MELATILQQAEQGFAPIPLQESQKQEALRHLEEWLTHPNYEAYRSQILYLVEQERWSILLDSFYRVIPFGTGGRRGAVGIGPNRINPVTIATSVQGHVAYLKKRFPTWSSLSVVIAYDVRQFHDLRKTYSPERPNPLLGLRSKDFARLAACVYAANGITSYILDPTEDTFISTPELSFLIRAYKAQGGLNVSASHNHPDDNGGKFYDEEGGQAVPPRDQEMLALVETVETAAEMPMEEATQKGWIRWIESEKRDQYIACNYKERLRREGTRAIVAYSPMNGTGSTSVGRLVEKAGYTLHVLPSQAAFDGSFEAVRYRIPNPEVPGAMDDVIEFAQEKGADLALATDPDADRIGLAAPDAAGHWRQFTGNEIAALLTQYCLQTRQEQGTLPTTPIVVKTEVTTGLVQRITEAFGGACIGELLVGFKYIGNALHEWETHGEFLGVKGTPRDFILGTEESHGFLTTADIRDKDAAGAALFLVEFASQLKDEGKTIVDAMNEIYQTYGYFKNSLHSMVMEGAIGVSNIRQMQAELRKSPPTQIGGINVVKFFDHWDEQGRFGAIVSETARNSRNVLVFHLEGNTRIILRPSGTEPKTKMYVEVSSPPLERVDDLPAIIEQADATSAKLAAAFAAEALSRIGIQLPSYALRISDLVSVDNKRLFAENIVPEWTQRAETDSVDEVTSWLRHALQPFGKQPHGLLVTGVQAFLAQANELSADTKQTLQASFDALHNLR